MVNKYMRRLSLFVLVLITTVLQMAAQDRNYVRTRVIVKENKSVEHWCFDTGYAPKLNTRVKLHFKYHKSNDGADKDLFGSWHQKEKMQRFHFRVEGGILTATYADKKVMADKVKLQDGAIYILTLDKDQFIVDKDYEKLPDYHDQVLTIGGSSMTTSIPLAIGTCRYQDNVGYSDACTDLDIYSCQIYEDNTLVYDFHPYRKPDNKTYDLIDIVKNDKILTSNSTIGHYEECKDHKYMEIVEDQKDCLLKAHCLTCNNVFDIDKFLKQKEDLGLSVIDPYLDVQADLCDVGNMKVYASSANQIYQGWLFNEDTHQLYNYVDCSASPKSGLDISLPHTEKVVNLALITKLIVQKTDDSGSYKDAEFAVTHFSYKPYHSIKGLTVSEIANPDSVGVKHPEAEVKWYIENPDDEDIQSADPFIVIRSTTPDFFQYETVGYAYQGKSDMKKVTKEDGTTIGQFSVIDDIAETQLELGEGDKELIMDKRIEQLIDSATYLDDFDKTALKGFYSHPSKKYYYQVYRAMAQSMWPTHRGKFIVEDSLATNSTLPIVTKINVTQGNYWSEDKNVTVRVELQNPYPWEYNMRADSAAIHKFAKENNLDYRRYRWDENAEVVISRYSPEIEYNEGKDAIARTFTVRGKDVLWDAEKGVYYAEIQDCQSLPYTHYYYSAKVDGTDSEFMECALNEPLSTTEEEANLSYTEKAALISNFVASRDLVGKVNVHWTLGAGEMSSLTLERREYSREDNNAWEKVEIANADEEYNDLLAQPGHVWEYQLTATYVYRQKTYSYKKTALGYPSYRGKLAGRVVMPNGVGIAGAQVVIKRESPQYIYIEDVYDGEGNLVMKGAQEGIIADAPQRRAAEATSDDSEIIAADTTSFRRMITTDETGAFELNDVLFSCVDGVSTQYVISVSYGGNSFEYAGKHDAAKISLNNSQPEKTGIKFICSSYKRVSGNVYYHKSTVPVRDVTFNLTFDGTTTTFRNDDGEPIKTDANGYFAILVPCKNKVQVQMHKDGHVFENEGYVVGTADESKQLDEKKSYDDGVYYDNTKTRLVGRLSGGNVEARKMLGFGLSKNNLGDNATIVLQLEGDNSSLIVYDVDHPEITEEEEVVEHPHRGLYPEHQAMTSVSYQRKRIVIKPDSVTGEFFVDLFPTKYKVTQLSAEGYSTLYNDGEGFDVVDLSDSIATRTITRTQSGSNQSIDLNASYVRVYHKPATVTYEQYRYGQKTGYLGDEKITEMNLSGEAVEATIAKYDKDTKTTDYLFGYPVFSFGNKYTFQVRAHEDYYYNNEETNVLDQVHLDGGTLIVQNGLLSNNAKAEYELDSLGMATIVFQAGNTTFRQNGENALRSMNFSVKLNDYYYEANSLKAFVTGYRNKKDIMAYDDKITILDVLRDPYGANSYSWIKSGAKYEWTHNFDLNLGASLTITPELGFKGSTIVGAWAGVGGGAWTGTQFSTSASISLPVDVPIFNISYSINSSYTVTTNEKITTSNDSRDIGAKADVYIGTVHTAKINTDETFSVIDETTYKAVEAAVKRGTIHIVKEGIDKDGKKFYLAIAEKIRYTQDNSLRQFAYTQKYILGTLIPNLIDTRNNLLVYAEDRATVEQMAQASKTVMYWSKVPADDKDFGVGKSYELVNGTGDPAVNEVAKLNQMIVAWHDAIAANEQLKKDHMNDTGENVKSYSIAGTSVDYSEDFSAYYKPLFSGSILGVNPANLSFSYKAGAQGNGASVTDKQFQVGDPGYADKAYTAIIKNSTFPEDVIYNEVEAPGSKWSFKLTPNANFNISNNKSYKQTSTASRGYFIGTAGDSYFDIDVVSVENKDATKHYLKDQSDIDYASDANTNQAKKSKFTDFLFYIKGGAARNPYFPADTTVFAGEDGKSVKLGIDPLKVDVPKLYIDRPIVNNLPEDEKAIFKVQLFNDSELGENAKYLTATKFTLYVDDDTNPNGAKFYIDGAPLTGEREYFVNPGKTVTKTLEVERGVGYDFNNIKLVLRDANNILTDKANVSINYLPMASKVNISSPTDKWVMNTFAATDDKGRYYIPVTIDGFNVHSDGFHHIELQYKKQTEGDSQWVTVTSFYNDSTLFAQATGVREMIPSSGKISNVKFYGEKDPMEMKYDLRAVAFRALGTGFATRASNVMTGIKDTRCPEVFGMPKPADGVLRFDDVISIPFNEPIAYNYLNKTSNFQVVGYLNDETTTYSTSLRFDYLSLLNDEDNIDNSNGHSSMGSIPTSKIYRNLTDNDFTVDMMVKLDSDEDMSFLYTMVDTLSAVDGSQSSSYLVYSFNKGCFETYINGISFKSESIGNATLTGNLAHVGMAFKQKGSKDGPEVTFFIGDTELKTVAMTNASGEMILDPSNVEIGIIKGIIMLGGIMTGSMTDARLWNKALSLGEFMSKKSKILRKNEPSLYAYWPIDEGKGNILFDKVNGCDLYFTKSTWQIPVGQHSLKLTGKPVKFDDDATERFGCSDYDDFTLSFWFNAKEQTFMSDAENDTVTLFKAGDVTDPAYFSLDVNSHSLVLTSGKKKYKVFESEDLSGEWHNVIVIVNKSQNTSSIYFDGQLASSLPCDDISGLAGYAVQFGDDGFHGNFDNFTFWNLAFPANSIGQIYNYAPTGYEMGLEYYFPFEMEKTVNGTYQDMFSPYNMKYNEVKVNGESTGEWAIDGTDMFKLGEEEIGNVDDKTSYCPVYPATGLTNIPFSWTATDNELQINLKKSDREINHQTLTVTVRNVEDLQGNVLANPQMMVVYVDKNVLVWEDSRINTKVPYGEDRSTYLWFKNQSGRKVPYSIVHNCSWMSIDNSQGVLDPLGDGYIEMKISPDLAPGEYETMLYLIDENGLSSSLPVNINVTAMEPEWNVTEDEDYKYTMNIMGQVKLTNPGGAEYLDTNESDIVAAFYNNICVGMTNITKDEAGMPYIYLTVKGNEEMLPQTYEGETTFKEISFMLWNGQTNQVSLLIPQNAGRRINFTNNGVVGCPPNEPVIFTPSNEIMQNIKFEKGWNWLSFNIIPKNDVSINRLLQNINSFTQGDRIVYVNKDGDRISSELIIDSNGQYKWSNGIEGIDIKKHHVYQLYAQNSGVLTMFGYHIPDADRWVDVYPNTSKPSKGLWNELPYLLEVDQPIQTAMSDYSKDKSVVGTVIKNLTLFAVADADGKWVGSLKAMHPGQGYYTKYISLKDNPEPIRIMFTNTIIDRNASSRRAKSIVQENSETLDLVLSEPTEYNANMPVIAVIGEGAEYEEGDEIIAYANGVVAGRAKVTDLDNGEQRFFISVNAEEGASVRFALIRDGGEVKGKSQNGLTYDSNVVCGSLDVPFAIDFTNNESGDVYDLNGIKYEKVEDVKTRRGVLIIDGQKKMK